MSKLIKGVSWGAPVLILGLILGIQTDSKPEVSLVQASASQTTTTALPVQTSSTVITWQATTTTAAPTTTTLRVSKPKIQLPVVGPNEDPLTPEMRAEAERNREWYRDDLDFCFQANPETIEQDPDPSCNRKVSTDPEAQPVGPSEVYIHPVDTVQPPEGVYYEVAQ